MAQLAEAAHNTSTTTSSDPMLDSLRNEVKTQKEQLEKQKTVIAVLENLNTQLRDNQPKANKQPKQGKKKEKKGGKKVVKQEPKGGKGEKGKCRNGKKKAEAAMRQAQITRNRNQTKRHDAEPIFTPWPWDVNANSQAQSCWDAADGVGSGSVNQMDGAVDRGGDRIVGTGIGGPNRFVEETRRLWQIRVGHTRSGGDHGQYQREGSGQEEAAGSTRAGYDRPPHRLM